MKRHPIFISSYDHHRLGLLLSSVSEQVGRGSGDGDLRGELERAIVVPHHARIPGSVATVGSRVAYVDLDSGRAGEAMIVFPGEGIDAEYGVSILEPLATALLGYSEGDVVAFHDGRRHRRVRILRVSQSSLAEAAAALPVS